MLRVSGSCEILAIAGKSHTFCRETAGKLQGIGSFGSIFATTEKKLPRIADNGNLVDTLGGAACDNVGREIILTLKWR